MLGPGAPCNSLTHAPTAGPREARRNGLNLSVFLLQDDHHHRPARCLFSLPNKPLFQYYPECARHCCSHRRQPKTIGVAGDEKSFRWSPSSRPSGSLICMKNKKSNENAVPFVDKFDPSGRLDSCGKYTCSDFRGIFRTFIRTSKRIGEGR